MKRFLLTTGLIIIITFISFGQKYWYSMDFENKTRLTNLTIDTISNPNNIWQIGVPQKTILSKAFSSSNVIITDSINTYPPNDTSAFIIMNIADDGFVMPHTVILAGKYYVNSDTLVDYGKIEFSPDNGKTWLNMLDDQRFNWYQNKPFLSGNSNKWKSFRISFAHIGSTYNIQRGDTTLYKFTFISDSIQTDKDGLMFDDLHFQDRVEGIEEVGFELIKSKSYPNPAEAELIISFNNEKRATFDLYIFNIFGKEIYGSTTTNNTIKVPLSGYYSGTYIYKLVNKKDEIYTMGKFIKK